MAIQWKIDATCDEWFVSHNERYWVYEVRPGQWRAVDVLGRKPVSVANFNTPDEAKKACELHVERN